jgi:hypothetical protein
MATRKHHKLIEIHSTNEIPVFRTETEEAAFWSTHSLGQELLDTAEPFADAELPPVRQDARTRPVSVRFDHSTMARLRVLARAKGKGYQTLLKEFVIERLYEEEKREGILPR